MPPLDHVGSTSHANADRPAASVARQPFVPPSFTETQPFNRTELHEALDTDLHRAPDTDLHRAPDADLNEAPDTDLPWIEEFAEQIPQAVASDDTADTWAIDEAGPSIAHIANDLASASASGKEPLAGVPSASAAPTGANAAAQGNEQANAHTPWQDDEAWMDIMPTLPNSGSHDPAMDTSWARAFAEPMAPMTPPPIPAGDTQAAAAALEAVARRLRSGEISVPGFKAESGDAAALAATLSALLTAQD